MYHKKPSIDPATIVATTAQSTPSVPFTGAETIGTTQHKGTAAEGTLVCFIATKYHANAIGYCVPAIMGRAIPKPLTP